MSTLTHDPTDAAETTPESPRPLYRALDRLPVADRLDAALANFSRTRHPRDERRADRALRDWAVTR